MNINNITISDLLQATPVKGYPYRHRRLTGNLHTLMRWSPGPEWSESENRANYIHLQESWAKVTGVRHDNHQVVDVRLADGTLASVMFSDWNLYVAEGSKENPPEWR